MTAAEVRAALERLRKAGEALRARPAGETLDRLRLCLDRWRDPASHWRRSLEAELPAAAGFSPEMVRAGLAQSLEPLSGDALRALVELELGGPAALDAALPHETTSILLAGALPTPTFVSLLAPLAVRSPVLAKTSAHDPLTAHAFASALAEVDADLGACLEVVSFPGSDPARSAALLEADCVVATGSDETVASVASRVRPPRRFVGHGHRVSVAIVGPEIDGEALDSCAADLAWDVAAWDQLGCLSPVAIFTVGERCADRLADALARELERAASDCPRGRVTLEAAAAIAEEREKAEFRSAAGRAVRVMAGASWTVVREEDARPRPVPLHRFVRVQPVAEPFEALNALRPIARHLAGVALAGFGAGPREEAEAALLRLGASRICPPGRLQAPPLDWPRDGQPVLRPFLQETGGT